MIEIHKWCFATFDAVRGFMSFGRVRTKNFVELTNSSGLLMERPLWCFTYVFH